MTEPRKTRVELDAEVAARSGCRVLRYTRAGKLVGLYYRTFESDPEIPWETVCETHGGIVCHPTRKDAEAWLAHPTEWCPGCKPDD